MSTAAARRLAREETDWARLYREGMPLRSELGEASVFMAPFGADRDLVVILVPCRRGAALGSRGLMLHVTHLARAGMRLLDSLRALGRGTA